MDPFTMALLMGVAGGTDLLGGYLNQGAAKKTQRAQRRQAKKAQAALERAMRHELENRAKAMTMVSANQLDALKGLKDLSKQGESDIKTATKTAGAGVQQRLQSRGLGSSSVAENARVGLKRGETAAINRHRDALVETRRGINDQATSQKASILTNAPFRGPDLGIMQALMDTSIKMPPWWLGTVQKFGGMAGGMGAYGAGSSMFPAKKGEGEGGNQAGLLAMLGMM
jgi:hypothetical protein